MPRLLEIFDGFLQYNHLPFVLSYFLFMLLEDMLFPLKLMLQRFPILLILDQLSLQLVHHIALLQQQVLQTLHPAIKARGKVLIRRKAHLDD